MKITSAVANKILKQLKDDKAYFDSIEASSKYYIASIEEDPVIPEYSYTETNAKINELNEKIVKIKHAINKSNATAEIDVTGTVMSVDEILVRMAQLNARKEILDGMRKHPEKARPKYEYGRYPNVTEYEYVNYNIQEVSRDYSAICKKINDLQIALDTYNQTVVFDVDIDV